MATKTDGGQDYPSSAYAYVPDPEKPSTWKLRLWETPTDKVTTAQVGRALAALGPGGFRGNQVEIPSDDLPKVKSKVLAAWKSVHDVKTDELPEVLKGVTMAETATLTLEDVTKKLGDLEKDLSEATKRADRAEAVNKLSPEDRAVYNVISVEKQQEFIDGDETVRKSVVAALTEVEKKKMKDDKKVDGEPEPDEDDLAKSATVVELNKRIEDISKELETQKAKATAAETLAKSERDTRQKVEFEKRAESEFGALPGTAIEKGLVLASISKLSTEEQAGISKLLVAGNEAIKQLGISKGSDQPATGGDAWGKIESLAKAKVEKSDKKITFEKAVTEVMKEDPKLYNDYLASQK